MTSISGGSSVDVASTRGDSSVIFDSTSGGSFWDLCFYLWWQWWVGILSPTGSDSVGIITSTSGRSGKTLISIMVAAFGIFASTSGGRGGIFVPTIVGIGGFTPWILAAVLRPPPTSLLLSCWWARKEQRRL